MVRLHRALYAAWGVDFIKVDDLSNPYSDQEIEAIRRAIDKCGRAIVLSTSPGETPLAKAAHVERHANMWRISGDFWDNWGALNHNFDLLAAWQGHAGPGHWPDADMIPLGHVGKRSVGGDRFTKFSKDEQITLMSLWALAPSPLMLGMNMPENDAWTLALLTNADVLAVNQDPLGRQGIARFAVARARSLGERTVRRRKSGGPVQSRQRPASRPQRRQASRFRLNRWGWPARAASAICGCKGTSGSPATSSRALCRRTARFCSSCNPAPSERQPDRALRPAQHAGGAGPPGP